MRLLLYYWKLPLDVHTINANSVRFIMICLSSSECPRWRILKLIYRKQQARLSDGKGLDLTVPFSRGPIPLF